MSLIRNQNAAALTRKAVVLDLSDIAGQAELIRQQGRDDAEQLIRDARQLARKLSSSGSEAGYKEGFARGHAEGFEKGVAEGHQEACTVMSDSIQKGMMAWAKALEQFENERSTLQQEARQDVLRLALEIGERIVYRVIEHENTTIEEQIAATLELLAERTAVVIQVNPADLETAESIMPTLLAQFDRCEDITIQADDEITRGGCYVRTGQGEIDARIETQIERIIETLLPTAIANTSTIASEANPLAFTDHPSRSAEAKAAKLMPPTAPISDPQTDVSRIADGEPNEASIVDSFLSDDRESTSAEVTELDPAPDPRDPATDRGDDEGDDEGGTEGGTEGEGTGR